MEQKKLAFNSFTKNIDGQEYCSEVETLAENMIENNEQDATIIYPAPGKWATFRAENFRLTTDGLAIVLPYPIYKIKSLKIKPKGWKVMTGSTPYWEDFKYNGKNFIVNATNYIVQQKEYNALPSPGSKDTHEKRVSYKNKSNVLTYEQGANQIKISSVVYDGLSIHEYPVYLGVIVSATYNDQESEKYIDTSITPTSLKSVVLGSFSNTSDPRKWEFQIEYIPMTSATKMKAHKAEATTQAYTQVVNQRAEVNNAEAFGRYLHTTAQKTGTEKLAVAKIYKRLADVPPLGAVVKYNGEKYRLIANSWNITNPFTFTVTHLLSKNWSSKSKHIAVDQKYRNWNIPFDSYIWRTIYYEEFVEIGEKRSGAGVPAFGNRKDCIKELFSTEEQTVQPLRNMFFFNGVGDASKGGVVLPTTTMAIGNSFVISAAMQDNLSAGLRVSATDPEFCEEVLYSDPDGTLEYAQIILSSGIESYSANEYPAALVHVNSPSNKVFSKYFYVDKDPGEALKITIQTHFLPNADWVVIGNKLAQTVPFISDKQRTFKLYALKQYIRDGVDKLDAETLTRATLLIADRTDGFEQSVVLPPLKPPGGAESLPDPDLGGTGLPYKTFSDMVLCEEQKLSFIPILDSWFNTNKNSYKAWAITDEDDNLLLGSNDINKREVHFNWARTRSKK